MQFIISHLRLVISTWGLASLPESERNNIKVWPFWLNDAKWPKILHTTLSSAFPWRVLGKSFIEKCFLTHCGRVTYICVNDLTRIGSDNGLSPGRHQAIIRTNAGILLIRPLGTNFSEFSVEILIFSFKKMRLKVSSVKRRPFCLGLNKLRCNWQEVKLMAWFQATSINWTTKITLKTLFLFFCKNFVITG